VPILAVCLALPPATARAGIGGIETLRNITRSQHTSHVIRADAERSLDQAVTIRVKLAGHGYGSQAEHQNVNAIEDRIRAAIGPLTGAHLLSDEFEDGLCSIYLSGQDADALLRAIKPVLDGWPMLQGGRVIRRYGPPGASEVITPY